MTAKNFGITTILALGIAFTPSFALAGTKQSERVRVTDTTIGGSFGSAHYSSSPYEYIACTDYSDLGISYCSARDRYRVTRSCSTSNSTMRSLVRSLSDSDTVYAGLSRGRCTYIRVKKGSMNAPK